MTILEKSESILMKRLDSVLIEYLALMTRNKTTEKKLESILTEYLALITRNKSKIPTNVVDEFVDKYERFEQVRKMLHDLSPILNENFEVR